MCFKLGQDLYLIFLLFQWDKAECWPWAGLVRLQATHAALMSSFYSSIVPYAVPSLSYISTTFWDYSDFFKLSVLLETNLSGWNWADLCLSEHTLKIRTGFYFLRLEGNPMSLAVARHASPAAKVRARDTGRLVSRARAGIGLKKGARVM